MNINQFYYAHKVLGISSLVRPKSSAFILDKTHYHPLLADKQQKIMLYFTGVLSNEDKVIIQKINQALGQPSYILIEVLKYTQIHSLFKNLLVRFSPRGFVIFDSQLTQSLIKTNTTFGKIYHADTNTNGCTLSELKAYRGDSPDVQKRKSEAWVHLQSLTQYQKALIL